MRDPAGSDIVCRTGKIGYQSGGAASQALTHRNKMSRARRSGGAPAGKLKPFLCQFCNQWHLGRERPMKGRPVDKLRRVVLVEARQ